MNVKVKGHQGSWTSDCYSFAGTAGDQLRLRLLKTSGLLSPTQEVVRPNGTTLCGPSGGDLTCRLSKTGTFVILVEDSAGTNTGIYAIAVRTLNSSTGCTALTSGCAPSTGSISAADQMDCYSFSGTAATASG